MHTSAKFRQQKIASDLVQEGFEKLLAGGNVKLLDFCKSCRAKYYMTNLLQAMSKNAEDIKQIKYNCLLDKY